MDRQTGIFNFVGHTLDLDTGTATFSYQLDIEAEKLEFIEELHFPIEQIDRDKINPDVLQKSMDNLLLILGISYYKLFCPTTIKSSIKLTEEEANFWNVVYTKGLGEFFYKNHIDFHNRIHFPFSKKATSTSNRAENSLRSLLFFSGGKDSIVSGELLKKANKDFITLTINPTDIQRATLKILDSKNIFITRKIDQQLLELNKEKIGYNGHVPFSAIAAFIGIFAATLYDFKYIITSNEHSANYGNVKYLGQEINHQWSKSYEFEKLFQDYTTKFITPDIIYFSLLRPIYEIKIVKYFIDHPQYFSSFSSCNRNFTIENKLEGHKWCGDCPKCLFVFIQLAGFLPKDKVIEIFHKNLLADENLLELFQQLLGLSEFKPFECVGTPEETKLALLKAYGKKEFAEDILMRLFEKEVLPIINDRDELEKNILVQKNKNSIPEEFKEITADL